jgi:hypothetical protein
MGDSQKVSGYSLVDIQKVSGYCPCPGRYTKTFCLIIVQEMLPFRIILLSWIETIDSLRIGFILLATTGRNYSRILDGTEKNQK